MLYVSTSRKPSLPTRRLSRWLEIFFGGECENRGKRSVEEIVARAEAKGYKRILLVFESHGNPSELVFLEKENWLGKIVLRSVAFPKEKSLRIPQSASRGGAALDVAGEKMLSLFGLKQKSPRVLLRASSSQISFSLDGIACGPLLKTTGVEVLSRE